MSYRVVSVFNIPSRRIAEEMQHSAMVEFGCTGIEEYSLNEAEVDELLGMRSYSGGDLPADVLAEVDTRVLGQNFHQKFYFDSDSSHAFWQHIRTIYLCEADHDEMDLKDWNSEWKKHYKPIRVSEEFVILPEWEDATHLVPNHYIKIHPGMGFGTGSHETTHLCLKNYLELEEQLKDTTELMDYGSGSGILGLSVLKRIPRSKCVMVDIDQEAHDNCTQNLNLNGLNANRVNMVFVTQRPQSKFKLVFANILQNILLQESEYLIGSLANEGYLILSGLLVGQLEETSSHYLKSSQLEHIKTETKGDWGVVVLRKLG